MHRDEPVQWAISEGLTDYSFAVATMTAHVEKVRKGAAAELIWLVEHPPVYTAGTGTKPEDILATGDIPVVVSGRGGRATYHGPGQRVVYVMLNVARRGGDIRVFVTALEAWITATLDAFNVKGLIRPGRVGVWVERPEKGGGVEDKIAAIGLRVTGGVSWHGLALNVEPDLRHFHGIVPCGIAGYGVTSLVDLGRPVTLADADVALRAAFEKNIGKTVPVSPPSWL